MESLDDLRRLPPPRLAPASVKVEVAFPHLSDVERQEFEKRLSHELAACGCREASIAVLAYFTVVALLLVFGPLAPTSWMGWLALVLGLAAASIVGKIAGLMLAGGRLRRVAAELAFTLQGRRDG